MNEIRFNALKALAISIVITLPMMYLFDSLTQEEREKFVIENDCYNEKNTCDLFPFHFLLMPIPIIIYYLSFNYFEKKRQKTWRSYN